MKIVGQKLAFRVLMLYLCGAIKEYMNHGSLFSGIGGAELAAEWVGWNNVFHCEINPFGRKVLDYYWPNSNSYEDITKTDFTVWRGRIDVLTGGFPCQPFSLAGKRQGTEDNRNLWPEMLRVIREIKPRWVVGENVFGFTNWGGGVVFEQSMADLENEGYEVQSYIIPACATNAPHRRDRIWIVAHANDCGKWQLQSVEGRQNAPEISGQNSRDARCSGENGFTSDTCNEGLQRSKDDRSVRKGRSKRNKFTSRFFCTDWTDFPTQSPVCNGNDGLPSRLVGITVPKWRNESIKAMGNSWVPQVAYQIFKAIKEYEGK